MQSSSSDLEQKGELSKQAESSKANKRKHEDLQIPQQSNKKQKTTVPNETGMTDEHVTVLQKFSVHNDVIIVWRPVNKEAANKIEQGYAGKALSTKGKSSNFGPIAGDIPFDARLSKIAKENAATISHFQELNEKALQQSAEKYIAWRGKLDKAHATQFNDLYLLTKVVKQDEYSREVCCVLDNNGSIIFSNDNETPLFVARDNKGLIYYYQIDEKKFSEMPGSLPENGQAKPVEILAYRYYTAENGESIRPITADYDELVSAARKIFPMHNNQQIPTIYSNKFRQRLMEGWTPTSVELDIFHILNYEKQLKQQHRDIAEVQMMGSVNDWQLNAKAYLKYEMKGATNHGPEVNNPFPEKLEPGNYAAYLPENETPQILKNEESICDFINKWREKGFPLDVNPKWGWVIDENGVLAVPEVKFNWGMIHAGLAKLRDEINSLDVEQTERLATIGLKNTPSNIRGLQNLSHLYHPNDAMLNQFGEAGLNKLKQDTENNLERTDKIMVFKLPDEKFLQEVANTQADIERLQRIYIAEMDIVNKKREIESLKLEPRIIYSKYINREQEKYSDLKLEKRLVADSEISKSQLGSLAARLEEYKQKYPEKYTQTAEQIRKEHEFDEAVVAGINQQEYNKRCQKIKKLEQNLKSLQKEFIQISTEISLVEKAEKKYKLDQREVNQPADVPVKSGYELDNPFRLYVPLDSNRPSLPSTSGLEVQQKTDDIRKSDNTPG